jgi:hypothetical protein
MNRKKTPPGPPCELAGTSWVAEDGGELYVYRFEPDGTFSYENTRGRWRNGTWKQDGAAVYIETNRRYAERKGTITGDVLEGTAENVDKKRWTFRAVRHRAGRPPVLFGASLQQPEEKKPS